MIALKKLQQFSLRLFAILCGFLLWLYVLSSAQTKTDFKVNIDFVLPDGYAISNHMTKNIQYQVEGPRALVRNIAHQKQSVQVNLKNLFVKNKMDYSIEVSTISMNFPFGVKVTEMKPKSLDIKLDKKLTKKVPIVLKTLGDVPSDHKLIQKSLVPSAIEISGPRFLVKKIDSLKTLPVDMTQLTQSANKELALYRFDKRIDYSQYHVDFQYEIQPTRANLLIKNVPINFMTTRTFSMADRRFVNLMVLAENENMIEKKKSEVLVIAKIPPGAKGSVEVKLEARMPKGLHLLEVIPSKVKVFVKK